MPKTITVKEAARLGGYVRQQIYNLIADGKIMASKRGWEYLIDRRSFEAYCQRHGKTLTNAG